MECRIHYDLNQKWREKKLQQSSSIHWNSVKLCWGIAMLRNAKATKKHNSMAELDRYFNYQNVSNVWMPVSFLNHFTIFKMPKVLKNIWFHV